MAHWIIEDKGFGGQVYTCSNCDAFWCDIFDRGMSHWKTCPNCGEVLEEDAEEEIDVAKLGIALKKIADAASKVQIPKLDVKMLDVSAFKAGIDAAMKRDENIHKLEMVSGMTIEELIEKFAAGWELVPTKYLGIKFEEELAKLQIEDDIKIDFEKESLDRIRKKCEEALEDSNTPVERLFISPRRDR